MLDLDVGEVTKEERGRRAEEEEVGIPDSNIGSETPEWTQR
jgi:hypothetical protein